MLQSTPTGPVVGDWPELGLWKKMKRLDIKYLNGWWKKAEGAGGMKMIDEDNTHFTKWHESDWKIIQGTKNADGKGQGVNRLVAFSKTSLVNGMIIEKSVKPHKEKWKDDKHGFSIDIESDGDEPHFTVNYYENGMPLAMFQCDSDFK